MRRNGTLFFDIECYKNFFLVMFRNAESGKITSFEFHDDEFAPRLDLLGKIIRTYRLIGFNSNKYDLPLVFFALKGATPAQLKEASDAIILGGLQPWQLEQKFNFVIDKKRIDHIDLIEVAPGKASLKLYGAKMHSKKLQELPIDPDALINPEQREELKQYCANDLRITEDLFHKFSEQIELREAMSAEYGIDLRSKSDAQVAEAVISHYMEKAKGVKPKRPLIEGGTLVRYHKPDFIRFQTVEMQAAEKRICEADYYVSDSGKIIMPKGLDETPISFGKSQYRIGIGGLHSCEQTAAHYTDSDYVLIDRDVTSYYPSIVLNCGLYPKHLGMEFLKIYKWIFECRIEAKKKGDKSKADSLKISLNGSFGKLGSKWSILYSPDLLLQVTLTGQLSLLMFIEMIETGSTAEIVSANTDGIVIKCPKTAIETVNAIIKKWEVITGFKTEETRYSAIFSRDINNFIAIHENRKGSKTKGAYAPAEPVGSSWPNPHNQISIDAVTEYLKNGTAIDKTITECTDIRKFLSARTVKGGAVHKGKYLGKAIRWYYKKGNIGAIHYKINNYLVPRTEGAEPLMELADALPEGIDYDWYINEARSILRDIGESLF